MSAKQPSLSLEEKLEVLRRNDPVRKWESLDDQRQCILCERVFSGRQVNFSQRRGGKVRPECPTENCSAGPNEWAVPGDPLLDDEAWRDWQRVLQELEPGAPAAPPRKRTVAQK